MTQVFHPTLSFETLFEQAACGLIVTDVDGRILRANTTFCNWLGLRAADCIGQLRVQDLLTAGGKVFHQTHWAPLLHMQGSVAEVKLSMLHRDGHNVPMLLNAVRREHGDTTYVEIAVMMVADRHKYEQELLLARQKAEASVVAHQTAQRALQESRDVLSLAMRGARMGAWSHERHASNVWWSRELEELAGFDEGTFDGIPGGFFGRIHPEDRPAFDTAVEHAVTTGDDYVIEFRYRHADNTWRWMEGRGRSTYGRDGQPDVIYGLGTDITDRRHAEEQLQHLNLELSKADRRKDEFLATLAHELRNPLAPMRNVLEVLRLKDVADPQLKWAREVFDRQLQHMTHLVDDLLEVSRITQGKLELRKQHLELAWAMQAAMEAARPSVQASSHHLSVTLPAEPIFLDADPTRLSQMILNLLNNAAKYTPPGGQILLCAERMGDEAVITVRDSGIGIPQEHLSSVFEMFSQLAPALDRSQGGLGIGLALVRGLVELHGGTITAHSEGIGKGSEFTIRLPVSQASHASGNDAPDECDSHTAIRRVLVVDDNEDAALSLAMVLELEGHAVQTAGDGAAGLDALVAFAPDVVVLDIGLPNLNGYEVARRIRADTRMTGILLIAVTGWGQQQDKQAAIEAGFDHHFTKPVDPRDLLRLLE
ncbi:ATP-binding protein [Paraburkholderia sp.]|uniref:PAS domain-containing hybrid sensor histidine kinase/response regulator n=1 Tax=Paraburkholderia sp. TaxID=1926495 RepID=UPI00238A22C0|nr:ATP-binding protein [Paraburkholderia sp.]MDE1181703.1 ATP-binding protein [Paraburkholderia sp.]